jgi:pyruvate,water dikinase
MLHVWESEDDLCPVTNSSIISDLRNLSGPAWLDFTTQQVDVWTRTLIRAKEILEEVSKGYLPTKEKDRIYQRLLGMMITRDPRILFLAEQYFSIGDLLAIGKRLIGTGLIGGKSVGMLLAHAILKRDNPYWQQRLEPHDSFFIGSDVFYTYIVRNGLWWNRWKIRKTRDFLQDAERVRIRMLEGDFPKNIKNQFRRMLDYFGQSPIIVRSSSLMEDAYKNSFSGKYESIFCPNQGNPEERLQEFLNAVRRVFASTLSEEALSYRQRRNLMDRDEQMALLVQRVSGAKYGDFFFPQVAGVGFSYNPYVWDGAIDPKMGMIRLVFGLGTRAVDRADDDYTRIVSLSAPMKRPESSIDELCKYAQRKVDLLDLKENRRLTKNFEEVAKIIEDLPEVPLEIFTSQNIHLAEGIGDECSAETVPYLLTFDRLLGETAFTKDMLEILDTLQKAYNYPVDVEFTANFFKNGSYRIFPVQCRPFQAKGTFAHIEIPTGISVAKTILKTRGPIVGNSIATDVDRIILVVPDQYSELSNQARYSVARLVGRLTHLTEKGSPKVILLLGPGRWATTSPSLGVPVSIGEINNATIICEIAKMHKDLYPDVSLGTHFFNDLVEMDMLYLAVYPDKKGYVLNEELLLNSPNQLEALYPAGKNLANVVRVIDSGDTFYMRLNANCFSQECIFYIMNKNETR